MPHHQTIPSSSSSQISSYLSRPGPTRSSSSTPTSSSVTLVDAPPLAPESKSWASKIKARVATLVSIKNSTSNIRRTSGAPINSASLPHNCKPILVKKVHSYEPYVPTVVLATVKSYPGSKNVFDAATGWKETMFTTIPDEPTVPSSSGPSSIELPPALATGSYESTLPPLAFRTTVNDSHSWSRRIERQVTEMFSRCHLNSSISKPLFKAKKQVAEDDWVRVSKENLYSIEERQVFLMGQPPQVHRTTFPEHINEPSHKPNIPNVHRIKRKPVDYSILLPGDIIGA